MLKHRTFIFLIASLLAAFIVSSAVAQRGIVPVPIKDVAGNQVGLYKGSYALVIGVSDYTEGWQDLESVPNEVDDLVSALEEQGFHVVKMLNPNSRKLKEVFEDFIAQYGFDPDNRLLFFFSGHGYTRQVGKITKGYLVPTDAPIPEHDPKGFKNKALSMKQIITWAEGEIESKHALFLFDSCFSGTILTSRSRPPIPRPIRDSTNHPVRQFISAGTAGQLVPSQSVFAPYFIRALKGDGDLNRDGYVTGTELGLYLRDQIMGGDTHQTPQIGKSFNPNFNEGDFVFSLLGREQMEQSVDSIIREREKLEQDRLNLEEKRKRVAALQLLNEEKRKLEEEKQRFKEAQDRLTRLQPPATTSGTPKGMVRIPGGEFMAGLDPDVGYRECNRYPTEVGCKQEWFTDEGPERMVLIDTFYMDKYEVTQDKYERVMGSNPSHFKGTNLPVESVSWFDADAYCKKVGKRLPTEAEWEKAAKGGRNTVYPWGNEFDGSKGNFCDVNCELFWKLHNYDDGHATGATVGSYPANNYGLYDMAGNVFEWTVDWYDENYYSNAPRVNPKGPSSGNTKVLRGGGWDSDPFVVRSAHRSGNDPTRRYNALGFRCSQ